MPPLEQWSFHLLSPADDSPSILQPRTRNRPLRLREIAALASKLPSPLNIKQLPMNQKQHNLLSGLLAAAVMAATPSVRAQTDYGTPASPTSTVTLSGNQLPPPPMPFEGVIQEAAKDSKPFWPARVVPLKGAPIVLLIRTDDQGYSVSSTFGGVIPKPSLDRIAKAGLRDTRF